MSEQEGSIKFCVSPKSTRRCRKARVRLDQHGFTFIELIMVIVMIGILSSIIAQKFIDVSETTEITAESATIDMMRSNLINNMGNNILQGKVMQFPNDPFDDLNKVPEGYDRLRISKPDRSQKDNGTWVYVPGNSLATEQSLPQDAGTTVRNFKVDGHIYHQRRDGTLVRWAYDSTNGIISKKKLENPSDVKINKELDAKRKGEATPDTREAKTR